MRCTLRVAGLKEQGSMSQVDMIGEVERERGLEEAADRRDGEPSARGERRGGGGREDGHGRLGRGDALRESGGPLR